MVRRSLIIFLAVLAGLWALALAVVAIQTDIFHRAYPYDTVFFNRNVRFSDFTIFYPKFAVYGNRALFFSYSGFPFTYPAPLLICYLALWRWTNPPLGAYLGIVLLFAAITVAVSLLEVPRNPRLGRPASLAAAADTISFPLLMLLDRANLEGFVWMATAAGIFFFLRRRWTAAAIMLGLAASMKLFPGLLLLLFLAKRRYREFVVSLASAALFTLASLWEIGPTVVGAARGIAIGAEHLRLTQALKFRLAEIGFDHSLFSVVKQIAYRLIGEVWQLNALLPSISVIYMAAVLLAFAALYLLRLRRMPVLNQLLALSAISITLPFVSYEYTLVHLAAPFVVLVIFLLKDVAAGAVVLGRSQILAVLLPYAVLFAPLGFLIDQGSRFGGQFKALVLIYLIGAASRIRLPSSIFDELTASPR